MDNILYFVRVELDGTGAWMTTLENQAKLQKSLGRVLTSTVMVQNELVAIFSDVVAAQTSSFITTTTA